MYSFIHIFIFIFGAIVDSWDRSVNKTFKAVYSCGMYVGDADKHDKVYGTFEVGKFHEG